MPTSRGFGIKCSILAKLSFILSSFIPFENDFCEFLHLRIMDGLRRKSWFILLSWSLPHFHKHNFIFQRVPLTMFPFANKIAPLSSDFFQYVFTIPYCLTKGEHFKIIAFFLSVSLQCPDICPPAFDFNSKTDIRIGIRLLYKSRDANTLGQVAAVIEFA